MSTSSSSTTTVTSISVAMFTVSDVDASIAFYTGKLGWELCADARFGENGEHRWVEVAPPGSTARLALNEPMGNQPGGGTIGVQSPDPRAEHERLAAAGVDVDEPFAMPGAPLMFMAHDPDRNTVVVVQP